MTAEEAILAVLRDHGRILAADLPTIAELRHFSTSAIESAVSVMDGKKIIVERETDADSEGFTFSAIQLNAATH